MVPVSQSAHQLKHNLQSFSFTPLMASEEMIFNGKLAFLLPWQPIKFRGMHKTICLAEDYSRNISVKLCHNICSEIAIKAKFHFSHYKSMETLSCQSKKSTRATSTRNATFVEANVMNISAKFQLYPPYGFRGDDF